MIRKPHILLLDEATSALDAESEHEVQLAIQNITKLGNQTVIVIAHRLSTIKDADCIYVMDAGVIVESGKHEDLIKLDGAYKALMER